MQDFPANSAKVRARSENPRPDGPPERIVQVTSAEASRRKRGVGKHFKETFIGGTARGAIDYVFTDVVVPTIRDLLFDSFQSGMERWVFGESRIRRGVRPPTDRYSNVGHVNYQGLSTTSSNRPPTTNRMISNQSRVRQTFDEIVIPSRAEAEEVLDRMFEFLSRYGVVKVAELYAMVGIRSDHTDHTWGWTSLGGAKVARLRTGGFLLDLPEPESLRV
jgi:hypothetical protein